MDRADSESEPPPGSDPFGIACSKPPRASVVVPAYQAQDELPATLRALEDQREAPDYEVLVLDNGSSDGTGRLARAWVSRDPNRRRLLREERPGAYAARNAGWKAARAPYVLFTDADARVGPAWVAALVAALDGGARLVGSDVEPAAPSPPERAGLIERYSARVGLLKQGAVLGHWRGPFLQTVSLGVRRSDLEAAGGFDEGLFSGGDADLCWRLLALRPGRVRLVAGADALVAHRHRTSWRGLWAQFRRYGEGDVLLGERYGASALRSAASLAFDAARVGLALPAALLLTGPGLLRRDALVPLMPLLRAWRIVARRRGQWRARFGRARGLHRA